MTILGAEMTRVGCSKYWIKLSTGKVCPLDNSLSSGQLAIAGG
jgi:hypothetical protein